MINSIRKALGLTEEVDFAVAVRQGAIIMDVRSPGEYASGNVPGSINIPLDRIKGNPSGMPRKDKAIITCCASGVRSATARAILQEKGYQTVYNGGSWSSLKHKITK